MKFFDYLVSAEIQCAMPSILHEGRKRRRDK